MWDKDLKDIDLIMHGSPCQDFSLAGKQAGGDKDSGTRSSLMYETIRIVDKLKPKYVVWENVKNLLSKKHRHNFDAYLKAMEDLGYTNYYQVLNAKDYGIPQNRERVFTISIRKDIEKEFEFPKNHQLNKELKELLENDVDEKHFLSEKGIKYVLKRVGGYVQLITNETKIAHCPITAKGNSNWTGNFVKFEFPTGEKCNNEIKRLFNFSARQDCRVVYDKEGICPTLVAGMGEGGGKVPLFIENKFKFPPNQELKLKLKDILENEVDEKYYLSEAMLNYCMGVNQKPSKFPRKERFLQNINRKNQDIANSVTTNAGNRPTDNFIKIKYNKVQENEICNTLTANNKGVVLNNLRIRKLTPKECWRLMGFDDEDFLKAEKVNSNTQLYKQAGNSIVVNVLEAIFKNLLGGN